jgi:ABC-type sugar transport system substrate-binding protein
MKKTMRVFMVILALVFVTTTLNSAMAGTFKIEPKGDKQIKIGVMDLVSAIEVAAHFNNLYSQWAKARGWDIQVFDLGGDMTKAASTMDNMITAGYDGIMINWTAPSAYAPQLKRAFDEGIPVIICAGDGMAEGMLANFVAWDTSMSGLTAEYLAGSVKPGSKLLAIYNSQIPVAAKRLRLAQLVFKESKLEVKQVLAPDPQMDMEVSSFDRVTNALLADTKKEIKGIWAQSDGQGLPAARAALALNREDVVVVTADDTPRAYEALRTMPNLIGVAGYNGNVVSMIDGVFGIFEDAFAGKPVRTNQFRGLDVYLVTKETAPPKGYFYNPRGTGYKGPKDY